MMFVTLAGCLMASAAAAQMASGRTEKGMMAGGMMKACQAMIAEREGMMQKMKAMDVKLDQLVARMNDADGDRKVEAMRAVIGELVAQRKAMRGTSMKMEGHMIGHMM